MFRFEPSDDVRHHFADGVLTLTVDRAPKRNPLSLGVLDSLRRLLGEWAADDRVRVALITGAGDQAFASGGDLAELDGYRSEEDAEAFSRHGKAALDAVRHFPVPVVARLGGLALGGGAELALACDQRLAAAHARIGLIHGRLAIAPSWGGGIDLVALVGPARALRLLTTAEVLDAAAAQACGLVDRVCPEAADFDAWFAAELAPFAAAPRQVARARKAIIGTARSAARAEADALETRHFAEVWAHPDHWDAVAALARK